MLSTAVVAQHLLEAKANTEIPNRYEQRPIDIARLMLSSPSEFDDPEVLREMIRLLEVS